MQTNFLNKEKVAKNGSKNFQKKINSNVKKLPIAQKVVSSLVDSAINGKSLPFPILLIIVFLAISQIVGVATIIMWIFNF